MTRHLLRRIAAKPIGAILGLAGRAYVPGHSLEDALRIARRLAEDGVACTLGYFHGWHETGNELAQLAAATADAVSALAPRGYVSVKAPAFQYEPAIVRLIADAAVTRGLIVHFDSHDYPTAEATLGCVRQAIALGARVGLSIPGRWRRSLNDSIAASQLGVRLRIVKGEWPDPVEPSRDMRAGFLEVVERVAGRTNEVAVATHDEWLARQAIEILLAAGTPCELELLNGLPRRRMLEVAREYAIPVRVYIPFGAAWRPYAFRKAAENPRILWWIARDSMIGLVHRLRRATY